MMKTVYLSITKSLSDFKMVLSTLNYIIMMVYILIVKELRSWQKI
jgi:hypothetical protein